MENGRVHHKQPDDAAARDAVRSGSSAIWAWVMVALLMAIVLAVTIAHNMSAKGPASAGDWIQIGCALGLISILTTLTFLRRQFTAGQHEVAGEAAVALFELDFESGEGDAGRSMRHSKRKISIGAVAGSIRQQASDIADITGKLANAYSADSGEPGTEQGRLRRITEAQASALAQIDSLQKEAEQTVDEIATYREKLAALEAQARFQSEHITRHATELSAITSDAQLLSRSAGTLQALQLTVTGRQEQNRKSASEVAGELKALVASLEQPLLAFRTSAAANGFSEGGLEAFTVRVPETVTDTDGTSSINTVTALGEKAIALKGLLESLAEIVKLLQVNLNFATTAEVITVNSPGRPPHLVEQESNNLAEASSTLAAARDMVAALMVSIDRVTKASTLTVNAFQSREKQMRKTAETLASYNISLARMAGTMAQTTGEVRFAALNMIQRLETTNVDTLHGSDATGQGTISREIHGAIENTILASQRIANSAAHLSMSGEMINRQGIQTHANVQELRILASNAAGNSQRLQHATSAATVKTDGLVSLTRGLVRKEDGAARRALANSVRISVQQKVQMIDEFALRVQAMEESAKMSKGPSPAIERQAHEARLPQVEFPVQ